MWGLVSKNVEVQRKRVQLQRNRGKLLTNPGNCKETKKKCNEIMKITINRKNVQTIYERMSDEMSELLIKAKKAKKAAHQLLLATTDDKNDALLQIANQLRVQMDFILGENEKDIENAQLKGFHASLIDRLALTDERINAIANALTQLVDLPDPTGEQIAEWNRPNGLVIEQVRVPLGVVGMIYEARPNVTVDGASLCLKTGNAVFLRGSSSTIHSNKALVQVIHDALQQTTIPVDAVQLLEDTSRETATQFFQLNEYLDVLIPRGGNRLIETVLKQATVPVLETGAGNCHLYIDDTANKEMAMTIALNAKTQRPSVCNTIETIIVHEKWLETYGGELIDHLVNNAVECRIDEKMQQQFPALTTASMDDWETEYLDKIVAIKVVSSVHEAIEHINEYGTKHSEAIVTETPKNKMLFFHLVDASSLYHNASTRFTDGEEFGFGAEIGISTQKLHARGPMGLQALTSTKYLITGTGQVR